MDKKSFDKTKKEWYETLKKHGFIDIENDREALKSDQYLKTKAKTKDVEAIREFYLRVDSYLMNAKALPKVHRTILEMYAQGIRYKIISAKSGKSVSRIDQIIKEYRIKTRDFLLL